ncbi:hypothetical protein D6792_02370 [Candidatus Parcubacteria bacterium]|nr:MAG: hypothetical protein D6792_02370 [Candidatus Parcubacteria bacterium]
MSDDTSRSDRQTYEGQWECSQCQAVITRLPFEPDNSRPLLCRECHRKRRSERMNRPRPAMVQGSWTCAKCGEEITELPFNPTRTDNLLCRDCHRQERMQ